MTDTQASQAAAAATAETESTDAIATIHKLKLRPPTYNGNYSTFDEWKYRFTAYMGTQDPTYPTLMEKAEKATTVLVDAEIRAAAGTTQEAESCVDTTLDQSQIHSHQHHNKMCSNSD